MSASAAQLTANRQNAQCSTGPVTTSGKLASSRNAIGPIAQFLIIAGEDESELCYLIDSYRDKIKPITQIEVDVVIDMATARWRRSRLLEFEASLLSNTMEKIKAELGPTATRVQIQALALERLIDG